MLRIECPCLWSKTKDATNIANHIGSRPLWYALSLRTSKLKVQDDNGENNGAEDKNEIEVEVESNQWQRFGSFRCVFCDKLQENGQGQEDCDCQCYFFATLWRKQEHECS